MRAFKWVLAVVVLVVLAAVAYRLLYIGPTMRAKVAADLNDPDSAKFRNERYLGNWLLSDGYYCGEINAKNRMGGYIGYQVFYISLRDGKVNIWETGSLKKELFDMCATLDGIDLPWWWIRW